VAFKMAARSDPQDGGDRRRSCLKDLTQKRDQARAGSGALCAQGKAVNRATAGGARSNTRPSLPMARFINT
jgi:hypothetical protein